MTAAYCSHLKSEHEISCRKVIRGEQSSTSYGVGKAGLLEEQTSCNISNTNMLYKFIRILQPNLTFHAYVFRVHRNSGSKSVDIYISLPSSKQDF